MLDKKMNKMDSFRVILCYLRTYDSKHESTKSARLVCQAVAAAMMLLCGVWLRIAVLELTDAVIWRPCVAYVWTLNW